MALITNVATLPSTQGALYHMHTFQVFVAYPVTKLMLNCSLFNLFFFHSLTSDGAAWSVLRTVSVSVCVLHMETEMLGNAISHIPFI